MATHNSPRNDLRVLAVKEVSSLGGYIVRARFDGLIRYFHITYEAANRFPLTGTRKPETGPLFRPDPTRPT